MLSIFIDFTMYAVPVTILGAHVDFSVECGIPLGRWLVGLLAIIALANL